MQYTSAQANKLLKKLVQERDNILIAEQQSRYFIAATTERLEDARPDYKIFKHKHNGKYSVPESNESFCKKQMQKDFYYYILISGAVRAVPEYINNKYEYKGEITMKKRTINQLTKKPLEDITIPYSREIM